MNPETVWPRAPVARAWLKARPEDFRVTEVLPFTPGGGGEHLWLWMEKRGQNTEWVARQLARWAGIRPRDVGWAGLKDRHAVTRQWFSLWLPGRDDPDPDTLAVEGVRVLEKVRHGRKLNRGALRGNRFELVLRQVEGTRSTVEQALTRIGQEGFPNYFGPQRFGRSGANVAEAFDWAERGGPKVPPAVRARHLSVLRSVAFNAVLAERVRQGSWNRMLSGEVLALAGSQRLFVDDGSPDLPRRVEGADLHPTGPLPGEGGLQPHAEALALEQSVLATLPRLDDIWRRWRVTAQRRPLRVMAEELTWVWQDEGTLRLSFFLPAGSFATSLLGGVFRLWERLPEKAE